MTAERNSSFDGTLLALLIQSLRSVLKEYSEQLDAYRVTSRKADGGKTKSIKPIAQQQRERELSL